MARITCEIEEVELENDDGVEIEGVMTTCSRCGHETESYGTSEASIKRCLVLMNRECPEGEDNFYIEE